MPVRASLSDSIQGPIETVRAKNSATRLSFNQKNRCGLDEAIRKVPYGNLIIKRSTGERVGIRDKTKKNKKIPIVYQNETNVVLFDTLRHLYSNTFSF